MWVYRSGTYDTLRKTIIYNFQKSRHTDHPREFLKDYSGILITNGYQVYHTADKEQDDLQIAECWVHAKRKGAELVKASGTQTENSTLAAKATKLI